MASTSPEAIIQDTLVANLTSNAATFVGVTSLQLTVGEDTYVFDEMVEAASKADKFPRVEIEIPEEINRESLSGDAERVTYNVPFHFYAEHIHKKEGRRRLNLLFARVREALDAIPNLNLAGLYVMDKAHTWSGVGDVERPQNQISYMVRNLTIMTTQQRTAYADDF